MEPGGGPRGAGAKRKAKKASNYYPTGPGLVAIFFQKDREGNEKDIQAVHDTFVSKLGFKPISKELDRRYLQDDLDEISAELKSGRRPALNRKEEPYASLTVFVLTHGNLDRENGSEMIETSDGGKIYLREQFLDLFGNAKLPPCFSGRPRIFFVQTCRGSGINTLVKTPAPSSPKYASSPPTGGEEAGNGGGFRHDGPEDREEQEEMQALSVPQTVPTSDPQQNIPVSSASAKSSSKRLKQGELGRTVGHDSHRYVGMASVKGAKAFKCESKGSPYVQSVCEALQDFPSTEVHELKRKVAARMKLKATEAGADRGELEPDVLTDTLTKRFRFVDPPSKSGRFEGGPVENAWAELEGEEASLTLVMQQPEQEPMDTA